MASPALHSIMSRRRRSAAEFGPKYVLADLPMKQSTTPIDGDHDNYTPLYRFRGTDRRKIPDAKQLAALFRESPYKLKIEVGVVVIEVSAKELAVLAINKKQLTLMSAMLFRSIKRREMESVGRQIKEVQVPAIVAITNNFNLLAMWVIQSVLDAEKMKERLSILGFFIHVAQACLSLSNFDSLKGIISGLQATPIHRLERTWAMIGRKERDMFSKMVQILSIDNNNEQYLTIIRYRKLLSTTQPPLVPFLGIYLSDLTYINECLRNEKDKSSRRTQYRDRQLQFTKIIDEIINLQSSCLYTITSNKAIMDAIKNKFANFVDLRTTTDIHYRQSYDIEARIDLPYQLKEDTDWKFASLRNYRSKSKLSTHSIRSLMPYSIGKPTHTTTVSSTQEYTDIYDQFRSTLSIDNISLNLLDSADYHSTLLLDSDEVVVAIDGTRDKSRFKSVLDGIFKPFRRHNSSNALKISSPDRIAGEQTGNETFLEKLS